MDNTIFGMPADQAMTLYGQAPQPQQRGFADYLPNVFGGFNPQVAGLLGDQQAATLSKQSNVSGLLGAAIALAQGMGAQGQRRSATQNILTALGSGLQASQGAYQQGIQNYIQQSQFTAQMDKQKAFQVAAEKYPDLAPLFKIAPEKAVEMVLERERRRGIDDAYSDSAPNSAAPAATPAAALSSVPQYTQVPQAGEVANVDPSMPSMPAVEVNAPRTPTDPMLANLQQRKEKLLRVASRLDRLNTKEANDESKSILEQIKGIDEQIGRYGARSVDLNSIVSALPPEFKGRGDALLQMQEFLTPDQLRQAVEKLASDAQLKTSDIQEYQFAKNQGFTGTLQQWIALSGNARAPKFAVNTGDPTAVAGKAMEVNEKFSVLTKQDREIASRYNQLLSAFNNPAMGGTGDAAMIYSVAKILDPDGAVREGDVAMIAGNRTYPDSLRAIASKFVSNQRLNQQERDQIMSLGYEIMAKKAKAAERVAGQYRGFAKTFGVTDPDELIRSPYADLPKPEYRVVKFNGKDVRARYSPSEGKYFVQSGTKFIPIED